MEVWLIMAHVNHNSNSFEGFATCANEFPVDCMLKKKIRMNDIFKLDGRMKTEWKWVLKRLGLDFGFGWE